MVAPLPSQLEIRNIADIDEDNMDELLHILILQTAWDWTGIYCWVDAQIICTQTGYAGRQPVYSVF